jgi:hypothetical protein
METSQTPLARTRGLITEELGDELLVYDLDVDRAHSLGPEATAVWKACDARTSVEGLASQLDLDVATVRLALEELATCELLEPRAEATNGTTRRELTTRVVKAGAAVAAVPLIVSVVAPTPAQAVTLAFCRSAPGLGSGCGDCCKAAFAGCCCCDPGGGFTKDCVPSDCPSPEATCQALHPGAHCSCGQAMC